jgi:hypothetical protein
MNSRAFSSCLLWLCGILALAVETTTTHGVVFTNNQEIGLGDLTYDGQDIVVSGSTLTVSGRHSFNSLQVINNGVVTHPVWRLDSPSTLELAIAQDLTVDASSRLDVSAKGCTGTSSQGNGPGGGAGTVNDTNGGGGGGGHGGNGGNPQSIYAGGPSYGSVIEPVDLGSAGGAGFGGIGGAGGGAIRLIANQVFLVNGLISANGASGAVHGYGASGGGAGGSIWITAGTLSGTGTINANGGIGPVVNEEDGGGGGGGRIALHFMTNEFAGTVSVAGGPSTGPGGQGTIHTSQTIPCIITVETGQVAGLAPMLSGVSAMVRPQSVDSSVDLCPNHCGYTAIELNRRDRDH